MATEKAKKITVYIEKQSQWSTQLFAIRDLLNSTELEEDVKWGMPTYTLNKKNVVGISGFKHHFGLWFFQGVFLKDEQKKLVNAQEGKTQAMRQLRFESVDELDLDLIKDYVLEAIQNHKDGKQVEIKRKGKILEMPDMFKLVLQEKNAYEPLLALSQSKQNEYIEYYVSAKREATRKKRVEKIVPLILEGKSLNDIYRK